MISLGIDPSGSERRRSGLAVLDDDLRVYTWTAMTNEEIFRAAREAQPDVVAIDSPLSLPKGRCCARTSCPCAVHGIVRAGIGFELFGEPAIDVVARVAWGILGGQVSGSTIQIVAQDWIEGENAA